jgi:hypothetical protein
LRFVRGTLGRSAAVTLAAVCLLGPILAQAHMLLVTHTQCAEHGEMLHVDGLHAGDAPVDTRTATDVASVNGDTPLAADSHEHDHCAVASGRKTHAAIKTAGGPATAAGDPPPQRAASESPAQPAPVAVYVLAPKNSPPV